VLGLPSTSRALIFASPDTEPLLERPEGFPYWEHVTQRRYEGPSVIYLGAGFALTARHVGMGEIFLEETIHAPNPRSKHTLLNENGTAADAMIFELEGDENPPDWPLIQIATHPPQPGEDVLLIGYGKVRDKVVEFEGDQGSEFAFLWSKKGEKRWATNRVSTGDITVTQENLMTKTFVFEFDEPFSAGATRYEAQAAVGDSGGGVFVKRDGEWKLAGLMISVAGNFQTPKNASSYGDRTHAADLTHYREEILRWTRAACANERDDDGDDRIDYPQDPGCDSAHDRNERDKWPLGGNSLRNAGIATLAMALILLVAGIRLQLERSRKP
jgi:hypothetical protein